MKNYYHEPKNLVRGEFQLVYISFYVELCFKYSYLPLRLDQFSEFFKQIIALNAILICHGHAHVIFHSVLFATNAIDFRIRKFIRKKYFHNISNFICNFYEYISLPRIARFTPSIYNYKWWAVSSNTSSLPTWRELVIL